ncbi:hypothetical protein SVAN01_10883 [Stagonosporopsis vannaccii]|nr:hypothetical protein SVAN01_10883 [Stagonosporopsis vannaccii]
MERLPAELKTQVCSYLPRVDLLAVTRTCSSLAAAAKPLLFEILTFHGDDQTSDLHMLHRHCDWDGSSQLPCYPVELAFLDDAVDKVIELGITKYAKIFQYSPKLYMGSFWPIYRDWAEEQMNEPLDAEDMDDESDAWDEDEEWGYVGLRRQAEARISRFEEERELFDQAESFWNAGFLKQKEKKNTNHTALVRFFRSTTALNSIDILEWSCLDELEKHGVGRDVSEEVECQFARTEILNLHLETLGCALQEAGVRIKHLFLPTISGKAIPSTPAVQHLFSALKSLSFNLEDSEEMLAHHTEHPPPIRMLIRCARNTLERMEFNNTLYRYDLPCQGEHLLEKLWGDDSEREDGTLVFPRLKHLHIRNLILYAPSLFKFVEAQSALHTAIFTNVYLHTPGYGWSDVAAALPASCQSLHILFCGGESTPRVIPDPPPNPNLNYNQIPRFRPHRASWPASCKWRISDVFIKRRAEEQAYGEFNIVKQELINDIIAAQQTLDSYTGLPLNELLSLREDLERRVAQLIRDIYDSTFVLETAEAEKLQ